MKINANFLSLKDDYLFASVADKVKKFKAENPDKEVIRLGIGDVTLPLAKSVTAALEKASREMGVKETFRGYGEYRGCGFLKKAVVGYYADKGVTLQEDEVFISDGAKSDLGNILDIFSADNTVLVPDPVYPVYVDTNIMAGRKVLYVKGSKENDFLPPPDKKIKADIIYLCSPNNPTGAVYGKDALREWVNYARSLGAVILFDAAYEAFVRDKALPTSIYQIDGAETCAVEFCSFSKTAGFTGTRCGYTVVPFKLVRENKALNDLWYRRQSTKFNGMSYIVQRGAEAVFTPQGYKETRENIAYYLNNAKIIGGQLKKLGIPFTGGVNSPYIWLQCPNKMKSWEFFDFLLSRAGVVGTPGAGFGAAGEGYFRLTAFGDVGDVERAMEKIAACLR